MYCDSRCTDSGSQERDLLFPTSERRRIGTQFFGRLDEGTGPCRTAVLLFPGVIAAQATTADPVTFTKDVAPILQRSCQVCHRDGSIAPMSFLTYEDARPWARAIGERREPRHAALVHRQADRDPGLQSRQVPERPTIVRWVDTGAPRGNPADMPEFQRMNEWHIADLIVQIPEPFVVAAEAPDWWGNLESESGLTCQGCRDQALRRGVSGRSPCGDRWRPMLTLPRELSQRVCARKNDDFPDGRGRGSGSTSVGRSDRTASTFYQQQRRLGHTRGCRATCA